MDWEGCTEFTPAGGLACHVDAMRFVDHIPSMEYRQGLYRSHLISFRVSEAWNAFLVTVSYVVIVDL